MAFAVDWPRWSRGARTPELARSAELREGPRGGGRDRDQIIRHTVRTESEELAKRLGLRVPEGSALRPDGLRDHRETYVATMRRRPGQPGSRPQTRMRRNGKKCGSCAPMTASSSRS